jgi:hypothetical protein
MLPCVRKAERGMGPRGAAPEAGYHLLTSAQTTFVPPTPAPSKNLAKSSGVDRAMFILSKLKVYMYPAHGLVLILVYGHYTMCAAV